MVTLLKTFCIPAFSAVYVTTPYHQPINIQLGTPFHIMEVDLKHMFFTNLQLLGMDMALMERQYKIKFSKDMFNFPNKTGSEVVLHFLFSRVNSTLCQQMFRDCWPVTDKKSEAQFRKICCSWLHSIQKDEADSHLPRINASLFLSPGGDKFCRLVLAFSTYVIRHAIRKEHGVEEAELIGYPDLTQHNKDLGGLMETTLKCAAIRHRRRFLDTLTLTAAARQSWLSYADKMVLILRGMRKEVKELDRDKRQQVQIAAMQGEARGSPAPASRRPQDFDMSEHAAKRAERIHQVRGLWKEIEGYLESCREEQDIVNSVIDKTKINYTIDAAHIDVNIPHLMLRDCEQEIHRRQVENVYNGGQLNLLSVLQLWNMALQIYIQKLREGGLKDLSDQVPDIRAQAHAHQAFLINATRLREKLAREVPRRKKVVEKLRNQFHGDVTSTTRATGLEMSGPSPTINFDLSEGHSGAIPTGPVVQLSPEPRQDTPQAAADLAKFIAGTSGRSQVESFQARAFGQSCLQNRNENQNNSSRSTQVPSTTIQKSSLPGPSHLGRQPPPPQRQQPGKSCASGKGRGGGGTGGGVQARVVRHFSRQTAATSSQKKPAQGSPSHGGQLASTPEKTPYKTRQAEDQTTSQVSSVHRARQSEDQTTPQVSSVHRARQSEDQTTPLVSSVRRARQSEEQATPQVSSVRRARQSEDQTTPLVSSVHRARQSEEQTTPPVSSVHRARQSEDQTTPLVSSVHRARQSEEQATPPMSSVHSYNSSDSGVETGRHRAYNLLADKIAWAVMHGDEEDGGGGVDLHSDLGLTSDCRTFGPLTSRDMTITTPSSLPQTSVRRATNSAHDATWAAYSETPAAHKASPAASPAACDSAHASHNSWAAEQEMWSSDLRSRDIRHKLSSVGTPHHQGAGDRRETSAEDINIEDPIAAISEEAFESHDLIGRSPLAVEISRMWRDAIADNTETKAVISDQATGKGPDSLLDSVGSDLSTAWFLNPLNNHPSSDAAEPGPASQLDSSHQSSTSDGGSERQQDRCGHSLQSASDQSDKGRSEEESSPVLTHRRDQNSSPQTMVNNNDRVEDSPRQNTIDSNRRRADRDVSPQTMINRTMAFVTSFDEDSEQQASLGDRTLEWEERLSALYGDKSSTDNSGSNSAVSFSAALDNLFVSKSPSFDKVPSTTSSSRNRDVFPSPPSPVISFSANKALSQQSEVFSTVAGERDALQNASWWCQSNKSAECPLRTGQSNSSSNSMSPARTGQKSVRFSPGESSDNKENCGGVVQMDSVKKSYGVTQTENAEKPGGLVETDSIENGHNIRQSDCLSNLSDKGRNILDGAMGKDSPRNGGILDVTPPELFDEESDDNPMTPAGGASPSNDSFTPLRWGMLIQGRSPAQSMQGKPPSQSVLNNSGSLSSHEGSTRAGTMSLGSLDEQLAAQLSKLQQLKARAFRDQEMGVSSATRKAEERTEATVASPGSSRSRGEPVGKEEPLLTHKRDPLDIFDQDDSLLLPASP